MLQKAVSFTPPITAQDNLGGRLLAPKSSDGGNSSVPVGPFGSSRDGAV
ncbi:hypothetical protein ARTHRO9AX_210041 [Arthrobacter sp. 9AX]|nr:hypothetical protein ARTHRO9AX_210041 [Arthrobacter sp. 9AX]